MHDELDAHNDRGVSLVEILVAVGVFALAAAIALAQLEAARQALAAGDARVEMQQALRAAFDRLTSDARAAGLAVHPDAVALRPDEAVEGAFAGALVIRADYDARTAAAGIPEGSLGLGGTFANVTTGNDEIVAYVLAKPDRSSSDALRFDADVRGVPRDGLVEAVTIRDVALAQDDPPYTLYRVTVRPDSTRTVRSPVIEHVRSLHFTYYDGAGNAIDPPGGADEEAARRSRASIRRIHVALEGLVRDPDPHWRDPRDPLPSTRRHRKFRLAGDVTPRNLDLVGMRDPSP
jgi:prepilin-type N-terminal cleavage/methylation domain-containing protein